MDINIINQNLAAASAENAKNKVAKAAEHEKLKEACEGFESIFLYSMLKEMRKTLPGNALFKESNSTDIYQSMHDQYLAEKLAKAPHAAGLKEFLYNDLKDSIRK
ncbi:MAG: flagellar biosynthesis protein FlgJ [Desulfobacteraceae bacterium]|nr:flagellar biosynthesis protein FlgJ [Desulfobacteraceae bacterium]